MKLSNQLILALVSHGALYITATTLDASQAYKVLKFRRIVAKAIDKLREAEIALIRECGLDITDKGEITGQDSGKERFGRMRNELYADSTETDDVNLIPYSSWHTLQQENKGLADAYIEDSLEGILWQSDEDKGTGKQL